MTLNVKEKLGVGLKWIKFLFIIVKLQTHPLEMKIEVHLSGSSIKNGGTCQLWIVQDKECVAEIQSNTFDKTASTPFGFVLSLTYSWQLSARL